MDLNHLRFVYENYDFDVYIIEIGFNRVDILSFCINILLI